jgi:hypothetical protein
LMMGRKYKKGKMLRKSDRWTGVLEWMLMPSSCTSKGEALITGLTNTGHWGEATISLPTGICACVWTLVSKEKWKWAIWNGKRSGCVFPCGNKQMSQDFIQRKSLLVPACGSDTRRV